MTSAATDNDEIKLPEAESNYHATMKEIGELACVRAGLGVGVDNTNDLHVMKYHEVMATTDKEKWNEAFKEGDDCIEKISGV